VKTRGQVPVKYAPHLTPVKQKNILVSQGKRDKPSFLTHSLFFERHWPEGQGTELRIVD